MKRLALALSIVGCVSTKIPDGVADIPSDPSSHEVVLPRGDGIVVYGDSGTGDSNQYRVADAMESYCLIKPCDLGLLLGDNFYPKGVSSVSDPLWQSNFEQVYRNLSFTSYPVLGNHDYMGSWQAQILYQSPHWRMTQRYYVVRTPKADIFAIDAEHFDVKQQEWLKAQLLHSTKLWQIVYGHRPLYSSGLHGGTIELKKHLLPILKPYGVDFYLAGHDHHLELQERNGVVHVVSGAAGKLRKTKPWERPVFVKSQLGFLHMAFHDNHLTLNFVDENGRNLFVRVYTR
jgi:tartrate-resistant acid phosphatase type 5